MPTCPRCGHQNKEGSRYCVKCGFPLKPTTETAKPVIQLTRTHILGITISIILIISIFCLVEYYILVPKVVTFTIRIESDTYWMGVIGADGSSTTVEGWGDETFEVTGTIVSAVIQKQTEYGYLTVTILRKGKILDSQTTTAPYGVVSVSASA